MKRKRHNSEQIVKKLRDADAMLASGKTIGQVCQALEVSESTFDRWRNQYGGFGLGKRIRKKPPNPLFTPKTDIFRRANRSFLHWLRKTLDNGRRDG